ncbi:MAG: hypothetical protein EOM25_13000 [Deltaproteobacteria bacterium]|nr:hypothetical protein [Deltaproteobacteria bacterium]
MKKKKHLSVVVSAEFHDLLVELAKYDDKTMSDLVRELFETLEPGLRQARDLMAAAHNMSEEARKVMMPEIVRHGEQIEKNIKYGMENIGTVLKEKPKDRRKDKDQEPPRRKLPL